MGKISFVLLITVLMASCAKDMSYESGKNIYGKSVGTLKDSLGDCQGITINGTYKADAVLTGDNFVLVQINVTTPGQYNIYTDTANGFWFRDTGYTSAGLKVIKLQGYGKPQLAIGTSFIVSYNNSFCLFTVTVGAGTTTPTVVTGDYFPTTANSHWSYNIAGSSDSLYVEATSQTATYSGNTYSMFIGKQFNVTNDTSYYRKDNSGNYYQYGGFKTFTTATGTTVSPFEYVFLKDNQPAGTQWDSPTANVTFQGIPTQVKMHYSILAKDISLPYNGYTIDSIIKVQNDLQYNVLGTFQTVSTGYSYYAKKIGLIDIEIPGLYGQTIRYWKVY